MIETPKYWKKQEKSLFSDLEWNLPEQKQGSISILGGNAQNFAIVNRVSSSILNNFPIGEVKCLLPDSLRGKIPPVPNILFLPSTGSGSVAKSSELSRALKMSDFNLILGDMSKNSETAIGVGEAIKEALREEKPTLITRDAIELVISDMEEIVSSEKAIIVGSMVQMQKIFRAVYYPKVLMLSMPIFPVIETLHKFTLSYKCTILTFHQGQIIVAKDGEIVSTDIKKTNFSPISLWDGKLAGNIAGYAVFNPSKYLEAAAEAVFL